MSSAVVNKISIRCIIISRCSPLFSRKNLPTTQNIFRFEDNFSFTPRWSVFGALEASTGNKLKSERYSGEQRRQMIITFKSLINRRFSACTKRKENDQISLKISHARYINSIITLFRGFQNKLLYLVVVSLYPKSGIERYETEPCLDNWFIEGGFWKWRYKYR